MEIRLPKERIVRTYQRYSIPIQPETHAAVKKLAFFYIGTQVRHIEKLTGFYEFGYTTISPDQAIYTLKRFLKRTDDVTIPDVIIAEGNIGLEKLTELHRFVSNYKLLADMPFVVEGTGLSPAEIAELKRYPFIDEILFLTEFAAPELKQKVSFLKKVKQQWVHQPSSCAVEWSFPLFPDVRSFFKRVLDLAIAATLLVGLSPVMLLIALALRVDSPGSVLKGYKRIGRGYRLFDLLKFRTDTKVGVLMEKIGMDDLPQLINVLLGDLSLVGHRPLSPAQAAKLTTDEWATRFLTPAGVTGSWQFRKGKEELPCEECMDGDNLLYDLWISPQAIVQKTNA